MMWRGAGVWGCMALVGCGVGGPQAGETTSTNGWGTGPGSPIWGEEVTDFPEFYPAADVPQDQVDLIVEDYETASAEWGNFGPLEFWIVGTDLDASIELDLTYCDVRMDKDPSLPPTYLSHCLKRGYNFADYVRDGGAALNVIRSDEEQFSGFVVTLASKYPFPDETDYTVVTYHEYFHVFQSAHIFTRDRDERMALMVENPWWSEGGAEYMAQLLFSRQPGVHEDYLRERMTWKMQSHELLEEGEGFTEIPYSERAMIAYDLGTWFIAYLVHEVGEDAYLNGFHDDLNDLGWEGAFSANFGMSSKSMLQDFEVFLDAPLEDQLTILPQGETRR